MLEVSVEWRAGGFDLAVDLRTGGGVTALFGPSGSGKTTLARIVAGLARPDRGRVVLAGRVLFGDGIDLPPHRRGIGYVFQEPRLFPHRDVRQNLLYGAPPGTDPGDVAEMLGIAPLLGRRPGGLSGGEAARVAIGRALLRRPDLLIMDEPLAPLDARRRGAILPYLERLRDRGLPILYISHAIEEVARLATDLVLIRDGRVRHAGPVGALLSDPRVAAEMGPDSAGALVEGVARPGADGLSEVQTPLGRLHLAGASPGPVRIRIRAEDVMVATDRPKGLSALNVLPGIVEAEHSGHGPGVMLRLRIGEGALLARVTRRSAGALDLRPGRAVWAVIKASGVARADIGR